MNELKEENKRLKEYLDSALDNIQAYKEKYKNIFATLLLQEQKAEKWDNICAINVDYSDDKKFYIFEQEIKQLNQKLVKIDKQLLLRMNSTPTNFEESAVKVFAHYIYELSTGKTLSEQLKEIPESK